MTQTTSRKSTGLRLFVVLVTVLVAISGATSAVVSPPQPPHNVDGVVQDQNGGAVSEVTVQAVYDGQVIASSTTGSDGRYEFDVPDPAENEQDEQVDIRVADHAASETITWESGAASDIDFTVDASDGGDGDQPDDGDQSDGDQPDGDDGNQSDDDNNNNAGGGGNNNTGGGGADTTTSTSTPTSTSTSTPTSTSTSTPTSTTTSTPTSTLTSTDTPTTSTATPTDQPDPGTTGGGTDGGIPGFGTTVALVALTAAALLALRE